MKRISRISLRLAMLFIAVSLSSCNLAFSTGVDGSGNITTETRNLEGNFSGIEVNDGIVVIISQSPESSITVEADDNLQRLIQTRIENGILYVEASEDYDSSQSPKVTIKTPTITAISASAGSSISTTGRIITPNLAVESDSGSEISLSVEAENLTLESASGSTIEAKGKAIKLETSSSSGSTIDAADLRANDVIAQTSSGSSTDVYPIVSLDGKANSGSSIEYANKPQTLKKEENSGGSVSQN